MSIYQLKSITDKKVWESYVLSNNPKSFLQSWNWGETNCLMGDKIFRLGLYDSEKLLGVCLVIKQNAKRGPYLLIPGGPILDWGNQKLVTFFIDSIREIAKKENTWFIRLRPELLDTISNRHLFEDFGLIPAPMYLHAENTWVLDITPSEEKILAGMRKNTRYLIKKSLNIDFNIQTSINPTDAEILETLQKETIKRHGFVGFSGKLFKSQLETFGKDNQSKLYLCSKDSKVLVTAIIIFYGNYAYYHHSASSAASREIPASYFLQWKIIRDAKNMDKKYYNFWGIAPAGVHDHRFSGVTTFKTGFGGERINWLHAHDMPVNKLYFLTRSFESVRKKLRGL